MSMAMSPPAVWMSKMVNKIGNIRQNSLAELWYGKTMNQWRLAHVEGRFFGEWATV